MRQATRLPASAYPFYDIAGPIAIVHRGGDAAGAIKENTLAAFDSAYRHGFIYAETDVVATQDGVVLAYHGTAAKRAALQRLTYADVQRTIRVGGEPMPTLEEVLLTFPSMRFFIDPKTPESVAPLAVLLRKLRVNERISVGGFSFQRTQGVIRALAANGEEVCTCAAVFGSLAFAGLGLSVTEQFTRPYLKRLRVTSFQVPHNWVTPRMVQKAHELGIQVIVWPMRPSRDDTPAYMTRALGQGVHGLMSDHTDALKAAVLANDAYNQSIRHTSLT